MVEQDNNLNDINPEVSTNDGDRMIGVCAKCGTAIYDESELYERFPKIKCMRCHKKETELKRLQHMRKQEYFKKSLIRPAIFTGIGFIVLMLLILSSAAENKLTSVLTLFAISACVYLASVQIMWDVGPVGAVFFFCLKKPTLGFGLIFDLSIDGIIWLITVKLALWILTALLTVLFVAFGTTLSLLIAPICFPFALTYAKNHIDEIGF